MGSILARVDPAKDSEKYSEGRWAVSEVASS